MDDWRSPNSMNQYKRKILQRWDLLLRHQGCKFDRLLPERRFGKIPNFSVLGYK